MKTSDINSELKKKAGCAAAGFVESGMICGMGTGSTVAFFIEEVGRRIREDHLTVTGVPTSFQAKLLCQRYQIPTLDSSECTGLDLAVDGADEVDPELNLIKGGGAAHTREKIVAAMANQFVVIVDESKLVSRLGQSFPIPVEVIPASLRYVTRRITELGGESQLRMGLRKDGPVVTDNGQFVLDVRLKHDVDLRALDRVLHQTPGVVETGLFFDLATKVLVSRAGQSDVVTLASK